MEDEVASETIEKELVKLERQYWQAIKDKDVDAMMRLADDPCIVTGAQGVGRLDHKAFRGMMKDASWSLREFELADVQVGLLRDDVAVVAYVVKEELTVGNQPVTLKAADSSTWVRRDGRWVCAVHTEALAGDPFGRDRRPIANREHAEAASTADTPAAGR